MPVDQVIRHRRAPSSPTGRRFARGPSSRYELPGIRDLFGAELHTGSPEQGRKRELYAEGPIGRLPHSASLPRLTSDQFLPPLGYGVTTPRTIHPPPYPRSESGLASHSPGSACATLPAILHQLRVEDELNEVPISEEAANRRKHRSWDMHAGILPSPYMGRSVSAERYGHMKPPLGIPSHYKPLRSERNKLSSFTFPRAEMRESRIFDAKTDPLGAGPPFLEPSMTYGSSELMPTPDFAGVPLSDPPRSLSRSQSSYSISASEGCPRTPGPEVAELPLRMEESSSAMSVASMLDTPSLDDGTQQHTVSEQKWSTSPEREMDTSPKQNLEQRGPAPTHAQKLPKARSAGAASGNGTGKFECSWCSKRFSRPSSLRTHIHSHTGEKPYRCDRPGCGRCFSVHSNLRRHQKSHSTTSLPDISGSPGRETS